MFVTETQIRIHYALTDQMGIVYYGHYAQFYEIGRTEAIRQIGYTYKEIEALGIERSGSQSRAGNHRPQLHRHRGARKADLQEKRQEVTSKSKILVRVNRSL